MAPEALREHPMMKRIAAAEKIRERFRALIDGRLGTETETNIATVGQRFDRRFEAAVLAISRRQPGQASDDHVID